MVTSKRRKQAESNESSEKGKINLNCRGSEMEEMKFGFDSMLKNFITQLGGWHVNC